MVIKLLVAADGDRGLGIVSDDDLDDGVAIACVEVEALGQIVENLFIAHEVLVTFVEGVGAIG